MAISQFPSNSSFSIGVEVEFQLLDTLTYDLTPKCLQLLDHTPVNLRNNIKAEFIQSMVEISTNKCSSISEVSDNLESLCSQLNRFCHDIDCLPYAASLHPFASLQQRKISNNPRYQRIMKDIQLVGKRLITQGLHIHIGLPDEATTIKVNNAIRKYLPLFLALSASSPYFLNEDTGFQSYRSKLFESLPRSGLPPYLENWKQFDQTVNLLQKASVLTSENEIWWDVRPHPQFGTIEIRICDLPSRLIEIIALTSVVHALVATLAQCKSSIVDNETILQNNKWQALRYGSKAHFINESLESTQTVHESFTELIEFIEPQLTEFNSLDQVDVLSNIIKTGNCAERYRLLYQELQNHAECIKKTQRDFFL